jgi:hypothetical protein
MSVKERMIELLEKLPDDVSVEEAIEKLYLLRKIEIGLQQADTGDVMDQDELARQLGIDE